MNLSDTAISTYLACPQLYKYRYVDKIRPRRVPAALHIGRAFHDAMQAYRGGIPPEHIIDNYFLTIDRLALSAQDIEELATGQVLVQAMAAGYAKKWREQDAAWKFEPEAAANLVLDKAQAIAYRGRVDAFGTRDGELWIWETKTASRVESDYFNRLALDWQILGYAALCKVVKGVWPKGIMYDVVMKSQIRQKKAETLLQFRKRLTEEYAKNEKQLFHRHEILLDFDRVRRWHRDIKVVAARIARDDVYPQNTNNCVGKYGSCSHLDICLRKGQVNPAIFEV